MYPVCRLYHTGMGYNMEIYKLLIVDDEEVEREGMAKAIPWKDYGIELVDSAWNGVEGLEKIRKYHPDIVMTDIKMPAMDGIELIRKANREFSGIEFIVLSGYGEYEYTSQAMEEGVRHYILKPCDEEKIIKAIGKVRKAIEERQKHKEQIEQYSTTIGNFLPRAKEQVLYNLLMGREQLKEGDQLFAEKTDADHTICLLTVRMESEIDYMTQFALRNILEELLEDGGVLLATAFSKEMVFILRFMEKAEISLAVKNMKKKLERLVGKSLQASLSTEGSLCDIRRLYLQTVDLFCMGGGRREELLTYDLFRESKPELDSLVCYADLYHARDMETILLELYLTSCKMEIKGYSEEKRRRVYQWIRKVFDKEPTANAREAGEDMAKTEWELLQETAELIISQNTQGEEKTVEERRMDLIILSIFEHLLDQELNIRYLAREILFMNEEYFSRLFRRYKKVKFSVYLLKLRIELAKRIMRYSPDSRISDVAKMVGFPEDAQYFSKVFRKETGMTPSQYCDSESGA